MAAEPVSAASASRKACVWVLEDSEQQAALAKDVLFPLFDVALFHDSAQLLEALALEQPDVLVLDWYVPEISGFDVLRLIRKVHDEATLPVLMMTATSHEGDELIQALDAGANDFVSKPLARAELRARVSTLARVRRLHDRVRRAEQEVRARELEWRELIDALPVLVSYVTADERYGIVNRAYENWFGLSSEALVGRSIRDVIGEAAYAVLQPYVKRGLAGEQFSFAQNAVPYRLGGTRDVKVTFVPRRSGAGAVVGYVALLEDVTMQRRLEDERSLMVQQRTEVLEAIEDAFVAVDPNWQVILVNRRFEQLTQRSREQTVGQKLWDLLPALRQPALSQVEVYQRCMQQRVDARFVGHDPVRDVWLEVRIFPTGDGGISAFFRDVSAEQRSEAALKRQAEFEQQLIGIVSHDLRTPLNAILLSASRLLRNEQLSEVAMRNGLRIQNAAERAARMVTDLLDFTQARLGGGISVEPRPTDLHKLVSRVLEEVEAAFPDREIELQQEGDGQGVWDPERIAQVVQNLITNALTYSPPDTIVRVTTRTEATTAELVVHNLGPAIAAEKLSVLFEPLQRAAAQRDRVSRSIGLGLYIVRQVVEAHHGMVSVDSTESRGTTFTVTLPRRS